MYRLFRNTEISVLARYGFVIFGFLLCCNVHSGIYIKSESWNEMPSQWKGWLVDHRQFLRCQNPVPGAKPTEMRIRYERLAKELRDKQKASRLTPDDLAELGGLLLRLGKPDEALGLLQGAQRNNPQHFRLTSHLCQAWCATGQWAQARTLSDESVRLAPGRWLGPEELMAKWIRIRQTASNDRIDPLFEPSWDGLIDAVTAGKPWEKAKNISPSDMGNLQTLALWFPSDPRLLAQTGVLCAVVGDVRQAALILEGAVSEFGVRDPLVMKLRSVCKDIAAKPGDHKPHQALVKYRSTRPLEDNSELPDLPSIVPGIRTEVPWIVFSKTKLGPKREPDFPRFLKSIDGTEVVMEGYLQPFGENLDTGVFLLVENAVGCWWCDMPDLTGMIRVELAENQPLPALRRSVEVRGKLKLNSTNPESHLFFMEDVVVTPKE